MLFVNDSDDHRVNRGVFVANGNSCAATGGYENLLADACADRAIYSDDVLVGELVVFDDAYFKKLVSDQLIQLVGGYDVSDYFSF